MRYGTGLIIALSLGAAASLFTPRAKAGVYVGVGAPAPVYATPAPLCAPGYYAPGYWGPAALCGPAYLGARYWGPRHGYWGRAYWAHGYRGGYRGGEWGHRYAHVGYHGHGGRR
jgi:hypothetical protein